ncbi:hypothetical protein SO802_002579 [Lithocarpus litseifolius]|uniref:Uncharacterized protein n=1 Tax=Lithocarpus litseifolius TaxID=425828 RepID=A0AAW2DXM4_9ROSI
MEIDSDSYNLNVKSSEEGAAMQMDSSDSSTTQILSAFFSHEINNLTVRMEDINTGKFTVIYNAKVVITGLRAPIVKDPREIWPSESALVWSEVSQGIMSKNWEKAKEAMKAVKEKQRELLREIVKRGIFSS